ncbi:MAG TPA: FtsX-like permease family protein [Prolixibacteraceae bacterium]|nr:FtsX-like permease family protein [Prolixibacteraceae bacterium]HPR59635.1 FtsX-like permease family protein [Prolixibacteraceae bacterium]
MWLAIKLAYRNLIGAGLRTWLNVIVLSFSFVVIIWMKGIVVGWDHQAKTDMAKWQIGAGQFWHENYDPFDPFTLDESYANIPKDFQKSISEGTITPMLIVQGTVYPQGRMQSVMIKGIEVGQDVLEIPSQKLDTIVDAVPAVIGQLMARDMKLGIGDRVTLRWRDVKGTFDATDIQIVAIFSSNVPAIESGQVYISLQKLQEMTLLVDKATIFTFNKSFAEVEKFTTIDKFVLKEKGELTKSIDEMIETKTVGQSVFYFILILLAMLAIFDTQVLSIFRRQKEIGTYIALGYTRQQVVGLFTVEGAMHSILAALFAAVYGLPFLAWQAKAGWTMPIDVSEFGMAIAQTLYPVYSVGLVLSTTLIIVVVTTIVSYWPSRKIAKMNPTEALRGKIQ